VKDLVPLKECPVGLFEFCGTLCLMTEYSGPSEGGWNRDAYVVESGEYFWGNATTAEERDALLVRPIDRVTLRKVHQNLRKARVIS
jgi:hypothetical protein